MNGSEFAAIVANISSRYVRTFQKDDGNRFVWVEFELVNRQARGDQGQVGRTHRRHSDPDPQGQGRDTDADRPQGRMDRRRARQDVKQKSGRNRRILDTSPDAFLQKLKYKVEESGGIWIDVPTKEVKPSQTCPACGHQAKKWLHEPEKKVKKL